MLQFDNREVVHIKVKLYDSNNVGIYKKFSIDPQITSFEGLERLISQAFDIKSHFTISYLATDDVGEKIYLTLLSDWDLDAAIVSASEPFLKLNVCLRPFNEVWSCHANNNGSFEEHDENASLFSLEDWDFITSRDIVASDKSLSMSCVSANGHIDGRSSTLLTNLSCQVNRTMSSVQRVIGLKIESSSKMPEVSASDLPLNDAKLKSFMDKSGRVFCFNELRKCVAQSGVEPSLRKVVWRLLLGVFHEDMSGAERMAFMDRSSRKYHELKGRWKQLYLASQLNSTHLSLISSISKDVIRTDRDQSFYAGNEDNSGSNKLFHLLVTFAIYHPSIGYAQGMSDLASPLLIVQENEANAYVCFCALMRRVGGSFQRESSPMLMKLQHLHDVVVHLDPVFSAHLCQRDLGDMWWAHRWLLLELKREFTFEESLRVLEIQWAQVPSNWLFKDDSLHLVEVKNNPDLCLQAPSLPKSPKDTPYLRLASLRHQNSNQQRRCFVRSDAILDSFSFDSDSLLHIQSMEPSTMKKLDKVEDMASSFIALKVGVVQLAPPEVLGSGNPFLLFLCFALVQLYRERILASCNDLCDISTLFTRTQRCHDVTKIIHQARKLFQDYLLGMQRRCELNGELEHAPIHL